MLAVVITFRKITNFHNSLNPNNPKEKRLILQENWFLFVYTQASKQRS